MVHLYKANQRVLSDKIAYLVLGAIILIYTVTAIPGITSDVFYPDYNIWVKSAIGWWPDHFGLFDVHLRFAMLKASDILFDNTKVLPFVISVGVLVTSFFFVRKLHGNNVGGIITVLVITTSNLFGYFDSSAAYDNLWILLYMLSLYVIERKWQLSPVLFFGSIFCKPLTVLFLPASIFYVWNSNLPNRKKLMTIYGIMFVGIIGVSLLSGYTQYEIDYSGMVQGLTDWWHWIGIDPYIQILFVPSLIILGLLHYKKHPYALRIMALQLCVMFSGVIIEGFTILHNEPYRYLPLVIFFGITIGMILKKPLKETTSKKEHVTAAR